MSSGLLLALAFPRFNFEYFAWIGLVPLLLAIRQATPLGAFWLGGVTGSVFYLLTLRWLVHTMVVYGHLPLPLSLLLLLFLVAYLSLYVALFAYLYRWGTLIIPAWSLLLAPALWTTLEWGRGHLLTGFPWANLAYAQFLTLPVIQIADITGIYGITFVLVFVNTGLAELGEALLSGGRHQPASALLFRVAGLSLLPGLVLGYGWWQINHYTTRQEQIFPALRVALLQGNIGQEEKWDAARQGEIFRVYAGMTRQAAAQDPPPDLIIWPEAATPFTFQEDREYTGRLLSLVREVGRFVVLGSPAVERRSAQVRWLNSAFLLSPQGGVVSRYDKIHLVPFGEYVPLRSLLFFVDPMVEGGMFSPGDTYRVMEIPQGRFAVFICYEAIFPHLVRRFVQNGARFLVNLTNDAWFGRSDAPYQHRAMVTLRAVENRVPVVRTANTGISALIDPLGRIRQETDIFVRTILTGSIAPSPYPLTFYTRHGDLFAYTVMGISASLLLSLWYRFRFRRVTFFS
ncbi:MAG: apolipoprotein N-acyltransferase [Nitrospinota bacterium]|nr:MAG: apolipoprotein N-acyltransferase [Nitrospinota bacterium]